VEKKNVFQHRERWEKSYQKKGSPTDEEASQLHLRRIREGDGEGDLEAKHEVQVGEVRSPARAGGKGEIEISKAIPKGAGTRSLAGKRSRGEKTVYGVCDTSRPG